jgi:hypothetical protein
MGTAGRPDEICSRIGLSKDMPRYGLLAFNFDLEYLKGVQNCIALLAQICLITNGLGGRPV